MSDLSDTLAQSPGQLNQNKQGTSEASLSESALAFWQHSLSAEQSCCNLPTDHPYWRLDSKDYQWVSQRIDAANSTQLADSAQQWQVSPFVVCQRVFALLLSRYTQEREVTLASYHQQQDAGWALTVLPATMDDQQTVQDFMVSGARQAQTAMAHSIATEALPELLLKLGMTELSGTLPVAFSMVFDALPVAEASCIEAAAGQLSEAFRLDVRLQQCGDEWHLHWQYLSGLWEEPSIQRMAENYLHLLEQVLQQPQALLQQLSAFAPQQKHYIDALWNHKSIRHNSQQTVVDLFLQQVQQQPDTNAICCADHSITYRLLEEHSHRIANGLLAKGIAPGDLVGLYLEDPIERVIALLAILRIGAAYLPFDNLLSCHREQYILQAAKPRAFIAQQGNIEDLADTLTGIIAVDYAQAKQPPSTTLLATLLQEQGGPKVSDLAYVIYTSGSQGKPNGVMGSHLGIVNRVLWALHKLGVKGKQVHCQLSSFSHVDHVAEIFQALTSGSLLLLPTSDIRNNADDIAALIAKYRVTRLGILPSVLQRLLADSARVDACQSLKEIFCSGEVLHSDTAQSCCKALPSARLFNIYGSTEVGADASYYEVQHHSQDDLQRLFDLEGESLGHAKEMVSTAVASGSFATGSSAPVVSGFNNVVQTHTQSLITEAKVGLEVLKQAFVSADIPDFPEAIETYVQRLKTDILPYAVNVSSPKFIGHMTSALPHFVPEFSKELIALNQNLVKIETSKALTFVERQVLAMLHKLCFNNLDYQAVTQSPQKVLGVFTGGGTISNITSLWCARNNALLRMGLSKAQLQQKGSTLAAFEAGFKDCVIIASPLAHYSMRKAASLLGIGEDNILRIAQEDNQALDLAHLQATIAQCQREKRLIIAMVGIAGATETGTIDPLPHMADIAQQHQIHFHVDAAWGGSLLFSQQYRPKIQGIERADSVTICAHKQLYMPQGISLCLLRDPEMIHGSSIHAEYQGLKDSYDLGQYSLEGSRPGNSMVLHAALYLLSKEGYGKLVDYSMTLASAFRQLVLDTPGFELVGEPQINIINYCYVPFAIRKSSLDYSVSERNQISEAVEKIQQEQFLQGQSFVSKTRIVHPAWGTEKITVFRVVLSNPLTTVADLQAVINDQVQVAHELIEQQTWQANTPALPSVLEEGNLANRNKIPIGQPIDNTQIYILDNQGTEVPLGGIGEIYIAGAGLALGYWQDPALTAQKFTSNSNIASRLYRTGDLGRINSSNELEYLGRTDAQIKIQGVRIDLTEIETLLLAHPAIVAASVLQQPSENPQLSPQICAYVSIDISIGSAANMDEEVILAYLQEELPPEMVPEALHIVPQLPVLTNGKVDRQSLQLNGR